MPLKAVLHGQPILAPLLNDREWAELYFQRRFLVLPCCPEAPVQMRGGAGTARVQHFSHTPLPTCAFRGETTAHLRAKVEIAQACADAGWAVDIEHAEDDWRADVLAVSGHRRVAFEAQWSRQTLGETEARQARYRAAGVRGCWFMRYPPLAPRASTVNSALEARRDLPVFLLRKEREREAYRVQVGSRVYPLSEIVGALLGGRIAFRTHRTVSGDLPLEITFYDKTCPGCGNLACLYGIAARDDQPPLSRCGSRILLWAEALFQADVADTARQAYNRVATRGEIVPLALMVPGVGFHCPRCRTRLVPFRVGGPGSSAVRIVAQASLTRPLCDPHPHWCYPPDGAFCAPSADHLRRH